MEEKKRTPLRTQILIFLVFTVTGIFLTVFVLLPFVVHVLLPNVVKLFPEGKTGLAVWLLLALFAALFVWAVSLFLRKKHRFLAVFLAMLAVFSAIKTLPYFHYDDPDPVVQPELAATFRVEGNNIVPQIYWNSAFVGSSMRSEALAGRDLGLSPKDQVELKEMLFNQRYTWIVTGEPLRNVTWSYRDYVQYWLLPWQTGVVYAVDFETVPGKENTIYVYRIPLAPIDNIF